MSQTAINYILKGREEFLTSIIKNGVFPKAEVRETPTHMLCISGIELEFGNVVWQLPHSQTHADEMTHILETLKDKDLPFLWSEAPIPIGLENNASTNSTKNILMKMGLQVGGLLTGVWTHLDSFHTHTSINFPKGVTIQPVQTLSDLKLFCHSVFPIHGVALHVMEQLYTLFAKSFLTTEIHYLAYQDSKPIGGITLSTGKQSAGLWNFATLASHRKKGVGSALLQTALAEAKQRGYQNIMALLMPTEIGNLWRQFHFQEVCHFPFYTGQRKQTNEMRLKEIRENGLM